MTRMRTEIGEQAAALRATLDALLPACRRDRRAGPGDPAGAVHRPRLVRQRRRLRQLSHPDPRRAAGHARLALDRDHVQEADRPDRRARGRASASPAAPRRSSRPSTGRRTAARVRSRSPTARARRSPRPPSSRWSPRPATSWPCPRRRPTPPSSRRSPCSASASGAEVDIADLRRVPEEIDRLIAATEATEDLPAIVDELAGVDRRGRLRPRHRVRHRAGAGDQAEGGVLPARHGPLLRRPAARSDRGRGRRHPRDPGRRRRRTRRSPARSRSPNGVTAAGAKVYGVGGGRMLADASTRRAARSGPAGVGRAARPDRAGPARSPRRWPAGSGSTPTTPRGLGKVTQTDQ